jgi:hypothetical protein
MERLFSPISSQRITPRDTQLYPFDSDSKVLQHLDFFAADFVGRAPWPQHDAKRLVSSLRSALSAPANNTLLY